MDLQSVYASGLKSKAFFRNPQFLYIKKSPVKGWGNNIIGFVCFSLSREGPASKSPVPLGKSLAKNKSSSSP